MQGLGSLGLGYEEVIEALTRDPVAFTELAAVRHETALAKIPAAIEYIQDVLETQDKVIVFAHHRDVIDELVKGLYGHGVVTITGATETEERQRAAEAFQNDPNTRIIIGSIGAMGTGFTLTASSYVVFVEQSYVPAEMSQAEDRAHRIGQLESVMVDILVTDGSVDANMMQTVLAKQEVADLALDLVTMEDPSGKPMVVRKDAAPPSAAQVEDVLTKLRYLAAVCDGAQTLDGAGFSALDSRFGKQLARLNTLSALQYKAAKGLLVKYQRQLKRAGFAQ